MIEKRQWVKYLKMKKPGSQARVILRTTCNQRPVLSEHLAVNTCSDTVISCFSMVENHAAVKAKLEIDILLTPVRASLMFSCYPKKKKKR